MEKVLLVVLFLYFINISKKIYSLLYIYKYSNIVNYDSSNIKNDIKINILIPVYKEQCIIQDTVDYFRKLSSIYKNVEVIFVSTAREWKQKGSTHYLLENIYEGRTIYYPYKTWYKGAQLNFAINMLLLEDNVDNQNTYIGIFDVDSRPNMDVVDYLLKNQKNEPIYQLISVYNNNYDEVSYINKANSIIQTTWSITFEYYSLLVNFINNKRKRVSYLIWHGLFVRLDILKSVKFSSRSLTEDLLFWYKVFVKEIYAKPLPYFDYCSVPNKIVFNIFQTSRWFQWELSSIRALYDLDKTINNIYLVIERMVMLIERLVWPIFVIVSLVTSLFMDYYYAIFFWLILTIHISIYLHVYSKYYSLKSGNSFILLIAILIKLSIDWLWPLLGIYSKIVGFFLWKKNVFYRTPK